MKINFDDDEKSSIEFQRDGKNIYIIITAPSQDDVNSLIINSASLSDAELNSLLASVNIEPILEAKEPVMKEPEPTIELDDDVKPIKKVAKKAAKKVKKKVKKDEL